MKKDKLKLGNAIFTGNRRRFKGTPEVEEQRALQDIDSTIVRQRVFLSIQSDVRILVHCVWFYRRF